MADGIFGTITGWVGGLFENDGKGEKDEGFDLNESNGKRRDESAAGRGFVEELAGTLTKNGDGTLHYSGDLGEFDYDASQWAVCLREEADGSRSPVMRYIGTEMDGTQIDVPDGLKKLDYAFKGKQGLTCRPEIPASVESLEGAFTGCTGMQGAVKTDIDTHQGSGVTAEGKVASDEELYARETGIGTKSTEYDNISYHIVDGLKRVDESAAGAGYRDDLGGEVTKNEDGTLHYSGYLGEFDYNAKDWAVGTRTTVTEDGYSAEVPVLRYVGGKNGDDNIDIPQGVRVLDYTFEGNTKLKQVPFIPNGVESAHCAFANCTKLTMACETAKDGEHQAEMESVLKGGGTGLTAAKWLSMGGSAIGTVLSAAGVGAASGSAGGIIGAAVGAAVGVGVGVYTYVTKDGKGGDWYLPSTLKDTSYMFDGCTKMTEAAQFADESALMNTQGMYQNNEKLGSDAIANKYGSKAVSDLTGTLVTTDSNSHMYEGTNTDYTMTPETAGQSSSRYWNDRTGRFEEGAYEKHGAEDIRSAEGLSTNMEVEAVLDADVVTDMDVASGGSASTGYYYDRNGEKVETTNANDRNELDKGTESGMGGLVSLLDRAVISYAEYKLVGMFTGANKGIGGKLLAAGGTFLLQTGSILPKSLKPVIEGVANMVGPDTQIGGLLNGVASWLPDTGDTSLVAKALGTDQKSSAAGLEGGHAAEIKMLTDEQLAQKDESDMTIGSVSGRMGMILDNPFGADSDEKLNILDGDRINAYMAVNARKMAQDNIFLTAANKDMNDEEFEQMGAMMELSSDALAEQAEIWAEQDGGTLSEEHRQKIADAYMKMLEGLDAYDDAALDEMQAMYGDDPGKLVQAKNGLGKVVSASVMPVVQSMMDMQRGYGLFTEEELDKLNGLKFTGIQGEASAYGKGEQTMEAGEAAGWQQTHGDEAGNQDRQTGYDTFVAASQPRTEQAAAGQERQDAGEDDGIGDLDVPKAVTAGLSLQALLARRKQADTEKALAEPEAVPERAEAPAKGREGVYTDEQLAAIENGGKEEETYLPGKFGRRMMMMMSD